MIPRSWSARSPGKALEGNVGECTWRTFVHPLGCTHKLRESLELVQLPSVACKYKPVQNRIVVLVDRLPEPFAVARHLDHLVRLLWIEDIPAFDKLRDAIQAGEVRG